MRDRIQMLPDFTGQDEVSGTEVRTRIKQGLAWEHLVPSRIVAMVRELYGG
jgi:nicotinic acid mononucleotide adenylyltransferase